MKFTEGLADEVIRAALQLGIKEFCSGKVRGCRAMRYLENRVPTGSRGEVPRDMSVLRESGAGNRIVFAPEVREASWEVQYCPGVSSNEI